MTTQEQKEKLLQLAERYAEAKSARHHYQEKNVCVPSADAEYSDAYQELYWYIERL